MRYIPISNLKEGMVLAKPFYGGNFEVLLKEGVALNANHIRRINNHGYPGVYIEDERCMDIDAYDMISEELRIRTVRATKEILRKAETGTLVEGGHKITRDHQQKLVSPLIDAIIMSKHRIIDYVDLKPYEDYMYFHAANVVVLSLLLGVELGMSGNSLFELGMAALLHDVGNIFIPKGILNKPGKLSPEEYEIVKQHTQMGFEFLKENFDISIDACIGALQHHENYDGTGYPSQLHKNRISVYGRIIAITDVYDALVSRRPYREALYPPEAMEFMRRGAGSMFDPELVDALGKVIALYPTGFCVELSTGVRCMVVENYVGSPARPRLRLINNRSRTPMYVDLQNDASFSNVTVRQIILQ